MINELREFIRFQTAKVTFKVIQGQWQWCRSIGHIQFPFSLPSQLRLYLAPFTRYYRLLPNNFDLTNRL